MDTDPPDDPSKNPFKSWHEAEKPGSTKKPSKKPQTEEERLEEQREIEERERREAEEAARLRGEGGGESGTDSSRSSFSWFFGNSVQPENVIPGQNQSPNISPNDNRPSSQHQHGPNCSHTHGHNRGSSHGSTHGSQHGHVLLGQPPPPPPPPHGQPPAHISSPTGGVHVINLGPSDLAPSDPNYFGDSGPDQPGLGSVGASTAAGSTGAGASSYSSAYSHSYSSAPPFVDPNRQRPGQQQPQCQPGQHRSVSLHNPSTGQPPPPPPPGQPGQHRSASVNVNSQGEVSPGSQVRPPPHNPADDIADCAICFDPLEISSAVMRCKNRVKPHYFHAECLQGWVNAARTQRLRPTCPCCRGDVEFNARNLGQFLQQAQDAANGSGASSSTQAPTSTNYAAEDFGFLGSIYQNLENSAKDGWDSVTWDNVQYAGGLIACFGWGFYSGYSFQDAGGLIACSGRGFHSGYNYDRMVLPAYFVPQDQDNRMAHGIGWLSGIVVREVKRWNSRSRRDDCD